MLVDASVELGRYDEAAQHVQAMLDVRPDSAALARASYLRELHGDLPGATAAMQQALSAAAGDPADTAAIAELLGGLQLASGDLAAADRVVRALAAARAAARWAPRSAWLVRRRRPGDLPGMPSSWPPPPPTAPRSRRRRPCSASCGSPRATSDGAEQAFALVRGQRAAARGRRASQVDLESALFEADHGDPAHAVALARSAYSTRQTVLTADALGWALTRDGQAAPHCPSSPRPAGSARHRRPPRPRGGGTGRRPGTRTRPRPSSRWRSPCRHGPRSSSERGDQPRRAGSPPRTPERGACEAIAGSSPGRASPASAVVVPARLASAHPSAT